MVLKSIALVAIALAAAAPAQITSYRTDKPAP